MALALLIVFLASCSSVDNSVLIEELLHNIESGKVSDAVNVYEESAEESSEKNLKELRSELSIDLLEYMKTLSNISEESFIKNKRLLDAVEFYREIKLEDGNPKDILANYEKSAKDGIIALEEIEKKKYIKELEEELALEEKKKEEAEIAKKEEEIKEKEEKEKEAKVKKEEEKKKKEEEAKLAEIKKAEEEKKEKVKVEEVKAEEKKEVQNTETNSQQQAVKMAQNYISFTPFSKSGLIEQLAFEGFDNGDAAYAADNIDVDWQAQANKTAVNYIDMMPFSRDGLIEQLLFEGFSNEHAGNAATHAGL